MLPVCEIFNNSDQPVSLINNCHLTVTLVLYTVFLLNDDKLNLLSAEHSKMYLCVQRRQISLCIRTVYPSFHCEPEEALDALLRIP